IPMFTCPAYEKHPQFAARGKSESPTHWRYEYRLRSTIPGSVPSLWDAATPKLSQLRNPAAEAMMMDYDRAIPGFTELEADAFKSWEQLIDTPAHGTTRNYLYFDGHAVSLATRRHPLGGWTFSNPDKY